MNKETNDYLDSKDPELVKAVLNKGPRAFMTIYNRLCRKCKPKAQKNPEMPFENYCDVCQRMITKVLE